MRSFVIGDQKRFMRALLTEATFDAFLMAEITVKKKSTLVLDGTSDEGAYPPYADFKEVVFAFIKGKETPSYMKFVLLSPVAAEGVASRALNILFRDGALSVTTGIAQTVFSLDREAERAWDAEVEGFLEAQGFTC